MSDEDIDLDRVVIDPTYRREVIDYLKKETIEQSRGQSLVSTEG
jgi:hypothetical protein